MCYCAVRMLADARALSRTPYPYKQFDSQNDGPLV